MLYHENERKNKENANFVYILYLLAKLCNIFDEAFFIDVSICKICVKYKYASPAVCAYARFPETTRVFIYWSMCAYWNKYA